MTRPARSYDPAGWRLNTPPHLTALRVSDDREIVAYGEDAEARREECLKAREARG